MAPSIDEVLTQPPMASKVVGKTNGHTNSDPDQPTSGVTNGNGSSHARSEPVNEPEDDSDHSQLSGNTNRHSNGSFQSPLPSPEPARGVSFEPGSHRIHSIGTHEAEPRGPSMINARVRSWGTGSSTASYPRLSKPLELMRSSYDCVVIGSGYGGGVAAARMARANQSVCVLERGKERWPGEFPSEVDDTLEQFHYSGEFAPGWLPKKLVEGGDPTGMYHMIFGNGQNAVVCNGEFFALFVRCSSSLTDKFLPGLGGTSLINANVYLEADKTTLKQQAWPKEIRDHPHELRKCKRVLSLTSRPLWHSRHETISPYMEKYTFL